MTDDHAQPCPSDPEELLDELEGEPSPPIRRLYPDAPSRKFACFSARLLSELHCEDVLVFDVRGISQITDYLVLASGTSDRQLRGVSGRVVELAKEHDIERFGTETDTDSTWRVIDFSSVMVHLFEPVTRAHYDLEMLWGDAPQIRWRDEAPQTILKKQGDGSPPTGD
ncbi:MAG: ribosome silencing factor [Phycisphaeraceae bacterium]